jgi:CheY-like chemotaxis protein
VVDSAVAAIRPAADAKRQSLELANGGSAVVLADGQRLQQVFWNLLSNAVKFTPPGGRVRVRVDESAEEVAVTVEDTGEGISAEFLPHVFERFRQAATSIRGRTGLGLGLAISKELVEMHGGRIGVQSDGIGHGSRFRVTLPRYRDAEKASVPAAAGTRYGGRLRSLRVLLVEDDDTTRTLLATMLSSFGAEVTDAASVAHAREKVAACDPQILITDIEMPDSDGVALLRQLREGGRAALPAIAVTGYAGDHNRERLLAAGFNGFVAKPLDPTVLAEEILRALS